jgi:hypothetical protein
MIRIALLAATATAAFLATVPAQAQNAGDKAWAACVWTNAPVSATNWLIKPLPTWATQITAPEEALGHRLIAICGDKPADETRPSRMPKWKSIAAALKSAKPAQPGTADSDATKVELCSHSAVGAIYLYDVVRIRGGVRTIAYQQYYTQNAGRPVRMPQDLRVKPFAESKITDQCQTIGSDGRLIDA